jgi:hypothetical protein
LSLRIIAYLLSDSQVTPEAVVDPMEKTSRCELGKRIAALIGTDDDVRMPQNGGGDKDGRARGKTDDELEVPQHEVAVWRPQRQRSDN